MRRSEDMKNLYIDMDGTLCRFYEQALCVEKCREPGFFRLLRPYENLVTAIQILRDSALDVKENFRIFILSSVYDKDARKDKEYWLRNHVSTDIPAFFSAVNVNKAEFAEVLFGVGLSRDDYLLDDYSKNLIEWTEAGGTGIKFGNELNCRGWNGHNFTGHTVYYDQDPEELAHDILSIMELIDEEKLSPDEPVDEQTMRLEIDKIMEDEPGWRKEGNGWKTDLSADYREELSRNDLYEIFCFEDPHAMFFEMMDAIYAEADYEERDRISSVIRKKLGERGGVFATDEEGFFLNCDTEDLYLDLFDGGLFSCNLPYRHFYRQAVRLTVMIDTGDGNREYVENAVYPHWDGLQGAEIPDTASILWLAKTQGISIAELQASLNRYLDNTGKSGFLETLGQELVNMPSPSSVLTFLLETTLENALEIADCMQPECLKNENPTIKIGKKTMTGLYDPWDGGGSLFEIELEQDIEIPLSIIRSAKPDGCDGIYSVEDVYGMASSAWRPTLLAITVTKNAA